MSERERRKTEKQKTDESDLSSACNEIEAFGLCRGKSLSPLLFCLEHTNDPAHHDPLRTQKSRSAFVTWYQSRVAHKED